MTPDQEERLVAAFESLAAACHGIAAGIDLVAMSAEARFAVEHPVKPPPRPMDVSRLKTGEDLIREEHGGEDAEAPLNRWTSLGPREASYEGQRKTGDDEAEPAGAGAGKV